ncbi:hypothetical protein CDD81_2720 [Ophiocordyceps australis]|uniref:Uncharacterized protein n=1 Tax=Ophiocordyceps australis TaxID=1399860 RepID=A0A2C5XJZ2_9HYPO|nr:hypothetical protein CDD81_2720 [Ophiocordyceps australis]
MLYTRVQTLLQRRRKQQRQQDQQQDQLLEISAPYDFKLQPVSLPGISQDELSMLRDKAAASRIGVYEVFEPPVYWETATHYLALPSRAGVVSPLAPVHVEGRPAW